MNVEIKESVRRYHVGFEQDGSKKFKDGRPQTVTTCKIWFLLKHLRPQLVAEGVTTLGKQDKASSLIGCTIALERALDNAKLGKAANGLFWQEFHLRHRRPTFTEFVGEPFSGPPKKLIDAGAAFEDESRRVCGHRLRLRLSGTDWCTKHGDTCKPGQRHEYADFVRSDNAGESIRPRSEAEKREQYRGMYGVGKTVMATDKLQAEDRCHRVHNITITNHVGTDWQKLNRVKIKELVTKAHEQRQRRWLRGLRTVSNEKLSARMLSMSLFDPEEHRRINAELLSRAGVSKVLIEYIIDAEKFEPLYKVGQVLRHDGHTVKVVGITGPVVVVQPLFGKNKTVMDWELELMVQPHILLRAWRWLRDTANWPSRRA